MSEQIDNSNVSVHLGKVSQYKSTYDKALLVREPRQSNRTYLGISDDNLPFVGFDTWNAYECSFLLDNGCPVTGVVKLNYPSDSKYIVESKSLKLYFNSYNMQKMGGYIRDAIISFKKRVSGDLSELLETGVVVGFIPSTVYDTMGVSATDFYNKQQYFTLESLCEGKDFHKEVFNTYKEDLSLLTVSGYLFNPEAVETAQHFHSALLKSNCRVTSQPDWGDVFIHIKSRYKIDELNLLKYIVSFRGENHFHEEICECIYKRLHDLFEPSELLVMCVYARRGGIDINPVRASNVKLLYELSGNLSDVNSPHVKTSKQ